MISFKTPILRNKAKSTEPFALSHPPAWNGVIHRLGTAPILRADSTGSSHLSAILPPLPITTGCANRGKENTNDPDPSDGHRSRLNRSRPQGNDSTSVRIYLLLLAGCDTWPRIEEPKRMRSGIKLSRSRSSTMRKACPLGRLCNDSPCAFGPPVPAPSTADSQKHPSTLMSSSPLMIRALPRRASAPTAI